MIAYPAAMSDTATMLRRNLRRMRRYYPSLTVFIAGTPVVFLLRFVFVLGGTLGAGLVGQAGVSGDRAAYLAYVLPGILVITVAGAAQGTAISVAMDMSEGIINRFRTMSVARSSVLFGHVIGSVIQTVLALVIVLVVAVLIGFRPTTGPIAWLAAGGLFLLVAVAITWLSVALGMSTKSVETASNLPMIMILLPFLEQRLRPDGHDAGRHQLVRPEPALHADHRDGAESPARDPDRQQWPARRRLVHRDLDRRVPVGDAALADRDRGG